MNPTWTTPYEAFIDASDLGLEPGYWPRTIAALGPQQRNRVFDLLHEIRYNGELVGYVYASGELRLIVSND